MLWVILFKETFTSSSSEVGIRLNASALRLTLPSYRRCISSLVGFVDVTEQIIVGINDKLWSKKVITKFFINWTLECQKFKLHRTVFFHILLDFLSDLDAQAITIFPLVLSWDKNCSESFKRIGGKTSFSFKALNDLVLSSVHKFWNCSAFSLVFHGLDSNTWRRAAMLANPWIISYNN